MTKAIVLGGSRGIGNAISNALKSIEIDVFAASKNDIDTSNLDSVKKFLEQIRKGKPLTVTDSRMTRFIMSIPEATNLILEVTNIAKDREVFILKMPSVRIIDLARSMVRICKTEVLHGKNPPLIKISKLREGERFHEFLITRDEIPFCHDMGKMYKITKEIVGGKKLNEMNFSSQTAPKLSQERLDKIINELLHEYKYY